MSGEILCDLPSCEKDCKVLEWEEWGDCSVSCGIGMQVRKRDYTPGTAGGEKCPCEAYRTERKYCNTDPCPGEVPSLSLVLVVCAQKIISAYCLLHVLNKPFVIAVYHEAKCNVLKCMSVGLYLSI